MAGKLNLNVSEERLEIASAESIIKKARSTKKYTQTVKIKAVEYDNPGVDMKIPGYKTTKILPNTFTVLSREIDRYGNFVQYITKEDFDALMLEAGRTNINFDEFWLNYSLKISSDGLYLNISQPLHKLDYIFAKQHSWVADNINAINVNQHKLYIEDEVQEAKSSNIQFENLMAAYGIVSKLSPHERRDILRLYGFNTNETSDEVVQSKLRSKIDEDAGKFLDMFNDVDKNYRILLKVCFDKYIIRKEGGVWFYNEIMLGSSLDMAVMFIKDNKNSDILIELKKQSDSI